MKPRFRNVVVATALGAVALSAQAFDLDAFKPRKQSGLWEFIPQLTLMQGNSGGPLDFAPRIPGLELLVIASATRCVVAPGGPPPTPDVPPNVRFEYQDRRQWLSTDGVPLPVTFETPVIATTPGPDSCQVVPRSASALPIARGTRVYLISRAFIPPFFGAFDYGVWHISAYNLDGSLRWVREYRPGGGPGADPDDVGWTVIPTLSAVGDLLGFGDEDDVIRVYRQRNTATTVENRYTFLDVLTGAVIKDIRHTVERPVLVP